MISWLGDFFRFWWALLYWNIRKTAFRVRGRGPAYCPCQSASDSGIALETRCEAASGWNEPARFRLVCPLLATTPDGLRCSVHAENVRPFWGRAAACWAVALLGAYLATGTGAFLLLKRIGYEVGLTSILWPGAWPELRTAQERLHAQRAKDALAAGNVPAAILALERVCQLNPRNEAAALSLANLWQLSGRPPLADAIYERLMRDLPARRLHVAQLWFRSLLNRADYARIGELVPRMLLEDQTQQAPWLHALFFATRALGDPAPLAGLRAADRTLPDWCVLLLTLEQGAQSANPASIVPQLLRVQTDPGSPYVPRYQIERLLALGRPAEALKVIEGYRAHLPADEAGFARLDAFRQLGWAQLYDSEVDALLDLPMRPRVAAQFCAFLLRHPDARLLARYFDRFVKAGPNLDAESYPLYAATMLASARCGDAERVDYCAELIRRGVSTDPRALGQLAGLLLRKEPLPRPELLLPSIPLPTEVAYALLELWPRPTP